MECCIPFTNSVPGGGLRWLPLENSGADERGRERKATRTGRIKTKSPQKGNEIELRMSTLPTAFGEKMVHAEFSNPMCCCSTFDQLGFPQEDQRAAGSPHGSISPNGISCWYRADGSGKTTTLLVHHAKHWRHGSKSRDVT